MSFEPVDNSPVGVGSFITYNRARYEISRIDVSENEKGGLTTKIYVTPIRTDEIDIPCSEDELMSILNYEQR